MTFTTALPLVRTMEALSEAIDALSAHKAVLDRSDSLCKGGLEAEVDAVAEKATAALVALAPHLPVLHRFATRVASWRAAAAWLEGRIEPLPEPVQFPQQRLPLRDVVAALHDAGVSVSEDLLVELVRASGHFVTEERRLYPAAVPFRWVTPPPPPKEGP